MPQRPQRTKKPERHRLIGLFVFVAVLWGAFRPDALRAVGSARGSDERVVDQNEASVPAEASSASGDEGPDAELVPLAELAKGVSIDLVKLAGAAERPGEREAFVLLTKIADGPAAVRQAHLDFLRRVLDPDDVGRLGTMPSGKAVERALVIERIVDAIALGGADGDEPFTNVGDVLIPLLGRGPASLRESVVEAVQVLIGWEADAAPNGGGDGGIPRAIDRLGKIVESDGLPDSRVLSDVCKILWEVDGKRFLSHVIAGLSRHSPSESAEETDPENPIDPAESREAVTLYLRELRSRVPLDFPTVDGWRQWWATHSSKSLPQIIVATQRQLGSDQADAWRRTVRRLRDTGDADAYLDEIEDSAKSEYLVEKRLAMVAALGEFADFVRALKFVEPASEHEKLRAEFLARACKLLISIAAGEARAYEFEAVSRRALSALARYQAFLESDLANGEAAVLRERIVRLVYGRFLKLMADRPVSTAHEAGPRWRTDLSDLVRTAGALKVIETRPSIEAILADSELLENVELTRAAVRALGRMSKSGLGEASARLLVGLFDAASKRTGEESLELRVECAKALEARPETPAVGEMLRAFYQRLLAQGDEARLHIPAIGGLSTLAQEDDPKAREALIGVLAATDRFDTPTLIAVVDAVAYIGGRPALGLFLPFLRSRTGLQGKDQDVASYLLTKVQGALRAEGAEGLAWILAHLENQAQTTDDLSYLSFSVELVRDPTFRGFLLTGVQEATASNGQLRASWSATLSHLRALELSSGLGEEAAEAIDGEYKKIEALLQKESQLEDKEPALAAEYDARSGARKARRALVSKLAQALSGGAAVDTQVLLAEFADLVFGRRVEAPAGVGAAADDDDGPARPAGAGDASAVGGKSAPKHEMTPRDRWAQLRWIESLLLADVVKKNATLGDLPQLWATFLAAEENASLWRGLGAEFRSDYLRRVVPVVEKSPEKES